MLVRAWSLGWYLGYLCVHERYVGVRPALSFSSIDEISTNGVSGGKKLNDRFIEIESKLLYAQNAPIKRIQNELNSKFQSIEILPISGKCYTTDSSKIYEYGQEFSPKSNDIYQYNGKLYTRAVVNSCKDGEKFQLSNGEYYKNGDTVWIEVSPVKGVWDKEKKRFIPYNILMGGVPFDHTGYYPEDFKKSDIGKYLNEYFIKELMQFSDLQLTDNMSSKQPEASRTSEEGTAIKPENEEVVLNGDTEDSNIHENTTAIEGTEQSAEEIANESTASNTTSIDKIIDYFNNLKEKDIKLEVERKKLRTKLDKVEAEKAIINKKIKEVEALIGKEGAGRDE